MSKPVDREVKWVADAASHAQQRRAAHAPWFKRATASAATALAMLLSPALAAASPSLTKQAELTIPDSPLSSISSASLSGDTAVVVSSSDTTRLYVFTRSGTTWSQQAVLPCPSDEPAAGFGASVSIDHDTLVAGSTDSGHAVIYVRSGTTWSIQATVIPSDSQPLDDFGGAVLVKGDTLVVGAVNHAGVGPYSGAAYVFTRSGSTWTQQAELTPSDTSENQEFGSDLALSGNTLAVGTDATSTPQAATYVFTGSEGSWSEQAKLVAPEPVRYSPGAYVALDGDTLVTGGADGAEVFLRSGGTWGGYQRLLLQQPGFTGFRVAIGGGLIAARDVSGLIHIFESSGGTFVQTQLLTPSVGNTSAMAIDGNSLLLVDPDFSNTHKAFVYARGLPPTDIALSASAIAENKSVGTAIGTFTTADRDVNDSFTYSLVAGIGSTDNGSFSINGNQLLAGVMFNYENKSSYSIRVRTVDYFGMTFERTFTITITNVAETNHAPVCSAATATPSSLVMTSDLAFASIAIGNVTDADRDNMTIKITSIRQDEVTRANSSDPYPDAKGVGSSIPQLRKQAVASGNGRVYTITFDVTDVNKATTCCSVKVGVKPKSSSGTPSNGGANYDSTK